MQIEHASRWLSIFLLLLITKPANINAGTIYSGVAWDDQNGVNVQGHGGSVLKAGRTYYWFGENKTNEDSANDPFQSIRCYASTDLAHWTYVSDALIAQPSGDLGPNRIVERPKVIYNAGTGKYVMYLHIDKNNYSVGKVGVATSRNVSGPYVYRGSFYPLGLKSWDIGLFRDDDGTAYLLSHAGDGYLHIDELSGDYLTVVRSVAALRPNYEAPAMCKVNGRYYLFGSELTGWNSNDNKYTMAANLRGPWSGWNVFGPEGTETYDSQVADVLVVSGSAGRTIVYLGDRWNAAHLGESTYVWLPLQVANGDAREGTNVWLFGYTNNWNLDVAAGTWSGNGPAPPEPVSSPVSLAAGKAASADSSQSGNPASAGDDGNILTRWCADDGNVGHWWKVDLGNVCTVTGTEIYWQSSAAYQYCIEVSTNNSSWVRVVDQTGNTRPAGRMDDAFSASARYVRITVTGLPPGLWASFYEFRVFSAHPAVSKLAGSSEHLPADKREGSGTNQVSIGVNAVIQTTNTPTVLHILEFVQPNPGNKGGNFNLSTNVLKS